MRPGGYGFLFTGGHVWVRRAGELKPLRGRRKGLYLQHESIKDSFLEEAVDRLRQGSYKPIQKEEGNVPLGAGNLKVKGGNVQSTL
jgi:hypothetical protein